MSSSYREEILTLKVQEGSRGYPMAREERAETLLTSARLHRFILEQVKTKGRKKGHLRLFVIFLDFHGRKASRD